MTHHLSKTVLIFFSLAGLSTSYAKSTTFPDPDRLLFDTVPSVPKGMKETARAARLTPVKYTNPFITRKLKNPHSLDSNAVLCITTWTFRSPGYKFPGNIRIMWGVYDSIPAAKLGALSRTWGQKATPPNPSIPTGSFSGRPIGNECWHTSTASPATIIVRKDRIVVQVILQSASKLVGKSVVFENPKRSDLALIEATAKQILDRTGAFLKSK